MSYTNAQLLRRQIGDPGEPSTDIASGDGNVLAFYLSAPPIATAGVVVTVSGVAKTETVDFTLDRTSGKLVFTVAPITGLDNVSIDYTSLAVPEADVTEALRIYGLSDVATADLGPSVTLLRAAAMVCDWRASFFASAAEIQTDGQSISRGQLTKNWADRAAAIREQLRTEKAGISTIAVQREDGYNASRQVASNDVASSGIEPRRRYYGQPDRVP